MVKVLIVDDDPDIRIVISSILRSRSYEVIEARDGAEALMRLKEKKPDLMLLDLLMPKMDGFAVAKELQNAHWREYHEMPILVISSVREEASQRRYELETGRQLGADDYIEKPIEPFVLLQRIDKLLSKGGKDAKASHDPRGR
ncbi:MAG: response regulator [Dehalococcoidia bacterium]|nr:response regulator [Dehalococcoidia bacterium]